MKHASPGSISSGTCNPNHLLRRFARQLDRLVVYNADCLSDEDRTKFNALINEARDLYVDGDESSEVLESLFDALESFAPPDHYFGSHPGDGADFGFWPVETD